MKRLTVVIAALVSALLVSACNPGATPSPTPNVQGTVDARVAMISTETGIAQAQETVSAAKSAIALTQTAMAVLPTSTPFPPSPPSQVPPTFTATSTPAAVVTRTSTPKPQPASTPARAACTFYVYADWGSPKNHFVPEGWMGDYQDIKFDDNYKLNPSRPDVIQITYIPTGPVQWAGIYWWDPPGSNFGNLEGGLDLSCASKMTFWARGEKGGEKAEFKVGGLKGKFQDSLQPARSTGPIALTSEWKQYTLYLKGSDLTHIIGGFVWVTNKPSNPNGATIYLDDIRFE